MEPTTIEQFYDKVYGELGLPSPIRVLKDCIKQEEWFKGIVLSTAFFEGVGTILLSSHFKNKISGKKFENLRSVEKITMFLFASGIIEQPMYSNMIAVNSFRNHVVHIKGLKAPSEPKLIPEEAEKIIEKAIVCLEELFYKAFEIALERAF